MAGKAAAGEDETGTANGIRQISARLSHPRTQEISN